MLNTLKILCLFSLLFHPSWGQQEWLFIANESSIKFTSTYDDIVFDGEFSRFMVDLIFDPNTLTNASINSSVDVTSLNTNSRDRDEALAEQDWFYFSKFPQATFTSTDIEAGTSQQILLTGLLKIRDVEKEITLPMDWQSIDSNKLRLQANFELDRRDYDIGAGEWKQDKTIGFTTKVELIFLFEKP